MTDHAVAALISGEMNAATGRVLCVGVSYPIDASALRRWRIAVAWPDPPRDLDSTEAPLDFNPFAWGAATESGGRPSRASIEARLGLPEIDLATPLNGGVAVRYAGARMRVCDVVRATTVLAGYEQKAGRRGPLLLTRIESRWTNQRDELVKTQWTTTVRF